MKYQHQYCTVPWHFLIPWNSEKVSWTTTEFDRSLLVSWTIALIKKLRKSYGIPALNVPGSYIEFCKNENMPWNYWQAHSQGVPWSLINIMKLCWKLKHINGRHLTSVEFCGVLLSFGDLDIFRIEVSNYKPVLIFWILNKQWIRRRNYFLIIITHGLHRRRRVCCRPLRPSVRPSIPPERRYRSNYLRSSVIGLKFGGMMHSSLFCHARPIFAFHGSRNVPW